MNLEEQISSFVNPVPGVDETRALEWIVRECGDGRTTLHNLVTALGSSLTSKDEVSRSRGTLLLSECLRQLPNWALQTSALQYLCQFYCDRIQDFPCQPEVLMGMEALLQRADIPPREDQNLCRAIFSDILLEMRIDSIKEMKADFVFGFVQAMDGEKDPRNLLVCFKLVPLIIANFPDWIRFEEDLFEVLACYFPINFNSRPQDPEAITKQQLSDALRISLSSAPQFAQYALPFFVEKFDNSNIKMDVIETMHFCLPRFGAAAFAPTISVLWNMLKAEIMSGTNPQVIDAALSLLSLIASILEGANLVGPLLELAQSQCEHHFHHYDSKLTLMAGRILNALTTASATIYSAIASNTLPLVIEQYGSSDVGSSKRHILLKVILLLISGDRTSEIIKSDQVHPLKATLEQLFEIFTTIIESDSASADERADAILCISSLAYMRKGTLLTASQAEKTVTLLTTCSQAENSAASTAVASLLELGKYHTSLFHTTVVPTYLSLAKSLDPKENATKLDKVINFLMLVAGVAPTLFELVLEDLTKYIKTIQDLKQLQQFLGALHTIMQWLQKKVDVEWRDTSRCAGKVLSELLDASQSVVDLEMKKAFSSKLILLAGIVSFSTPPNLQLDVVALLKPNAALSSDINTASLAEAKDSILVYAAAVSGLHENVTIEQISETVRLFTRILVDPVFNLTSFERKELATSIGALLNKFNGPSEEFDKLLGILEIPDNTTNFSSGHFDLFVSTCKGLSTRLHPKATPYWKHLISLLSTLSEIDAVYLAKCFSELFRDNRLYTKTRALYKQKYFTLALPLLVKGLDDSSSNRRAVFVCAICSLLLSLPLTVVLVELSQLLPVLIEAIKIPLDVWKLFAGDESSEVSLHDTVVIVLFRLAKESPIQVSDHLGTLIPRLLDLAVDRTHAPASLRESSLELLVDITTTLPFVRVQRYRDLVLKRVKQALDDPKRAVRKAASRVSNDWAVLAESS